MKNKSKEIDRTAKEAADFFTAIIADILNIEPIKIEYGNYSLTHATLEAESNDCLKPVIRIATNRIDSKPLLFFSIAHEMRHVYQRHELCLNNEISTYTRKELDIIKGEFALSNPDDYLNHDLKEYNSRFVELDAHAFAFCIMNLLFGIHIKIEDYPWIDMKTFDSFVARIFEEGILEDISEIYEDYYPAIQKIRSWLVS